MRKFLLSKVNICFLLIIFVSMSFLFFYKISISYRMDADYNYDSDLGRDLLKMTEISQGNLTLVGPQLSFLAIRMTPFSFYLFAPFLFLGNYDHRAVLFANAAIFLAGFLILYCFFQKKFGNLYSFLSVIWVSTSSYMILSARSPGNAFSYLIFLVFFTVLIFGSWVDSLKKVFLIGLTAGVITNFHPVNIILAPFLFLGFLVKQPLVKNVKYKYLVIFTVGFLLTFLPLIVFDLRNNFLLSKTILEPLGYYNFFTIQDNSTVGISLNKFMSLNKNLASYISTTIFGLVIISLFLIILIKKSRKFFLYFLIGLLNVIVVFGAGKGAAHYFFPMIVLFQVFIIYSLSFARIKIIVLIVLISLNLVFFPTHFYKWARNLLTVEENFSQVLKSNFLPDAPINIVLLNQTNLSKVGYEYRFLLTKNKKEVLGEYSYNKSPYLLLISERGPIDWTKEKSWEVEQFGNKVLVDSITVGNTVYYLFKHI